MGKKYGAVSFLQILAPELNDRLLADFLDMEMKANEYGINNLKRVMENILTWTAQPDGEYTDLTTIYNSVRAQHLKYTHRLRPVPRQTQ